MICMPPSAVSEKAFDLRRASNAFFSFFSSIPNLSSVETLRMECSERRLCQ